MNQDEFLSMYANNQSKRFNLGHDFCKELVNTQVDGYREIPTVIECKY